MKLLGFNISISRNAAPVPAQKALGASPEAWLRGGDPDRAGPILANAYEQVVWVYRAINVLAEQVANVPFLFSSGERGRENLLTSGPLLEFYSRPHPQINRYQYWELRVIWLMLRGECFRVPVFEDGARATRKPRLKQILLLDPARFQHIIEDHRLIGWRYTGFGPQTPIASQVFLPEEVWFEKLPNPFDFWRGFPPLYVAEMAARTDFAAAAFMRGLIENNADTGIIVRSNEWLSDEQREQILAALRDRKRRAGQADRPVLLLGSTEVVQPKLSSSDLQFLENRKFSRAEICAAFGVPEEIVTTTDNSKYDVMAGARLNFIENRVAPLCSRLEAEEDATVKSIDPAASGWFDLDSLPIMQEARRNRLEAARTGFEMGVPFNELNRVLDLGFKPLAWGDRGYVGSKLREVVAQASSPAGSGGVPPPQPPDGTDGKLAGETLTLQSPQLASRFRRFFFEQRARVLAKISASNWPQTSGGPVPPLLDLASENAQLAAAIGPLLGAELRAAAAAEPGAAQKPLSAEEVQSRIRSWETAVREVNRATLEELDQAVSHSRAGNESQARLAARIKGIFNAKARPK